MAEKQIDGQETISTMSTSGNLRYLKGVRTRFRNTLKEEMEKATELLTGEAEEHELDDKLNRASSHMEKINLYREKLEIQSEKLVLSMGDSEDIDMFLDDDCGLCSHGMDIYLELKTYSAKLHQLKDRLGNNTYEDSDTHMLIQLQQNMQQLLSSQIKQQESTNRKQAEKLSSVKLPKIDMISFAGDKTKWIEFWDCFQSAVHNNKMISDIEKFTYLKSKLFGEAKSAIAGLALSSDNYQVAMDILKKRFGNSQEIIDLHYKPLLNIPSSTNRVSSLRYLIDNVDKHFRSLEVLYQNVNQDIIVSIIKSKLPEDVLLQLEIMKDVDEIWTVRTMSKRLNDYIIARERASKDTNFKQRGSTTISYMGKEQSFMPAQRNRTSESTTRHTTEAFIAGESRRNMQSPTKVCKYCNGEHWSDECKKYKTIEERKKRLKGSCYQCLKDNHRAKDCRSSRICTYCKKANVHHRSLCDKKFKMKPIQECANLSNEVESVCIENTNIINEETGLLSYNESVLMQTACTKIKNANNGQSEQVRVMLDCGSHRTYVSQSLADRLKLEVIGEQRINLITFGSRSKKVIQTKSTKLDIKLKNGQYMSLNADIVPNITGTISRKAVKLKSHSHFEYLTKDLTLADTIPTENETETLDLLIGNDYYLDIVQADKIEIQPGLYLLSSNLGWIISGRTEVSDGYDSSDMNMLILNYGSNVTKTNVFSNVDSVLPTKPDIEDFWNVESIGITDEKENSDDQLVMQHFKDTLKHEDGRYQVTWPWKRDIDELPENRGLAVGRLKSLVTRIEKQPELKQRYDDVIQDQLQKGVIERVDKNTEDGYKHYIPHHVVITPTKSTTKLRVVYDASAKTRSDNKSLNECLYRGPVKLHDLCGILMRFRLNKIGIVADIEKAFLQVGLQPLERDVTRFLWLKDINKSVIQEENIQEFRFARVPFGVISSPFLLGATIECHLDSYESEIAGKLKNDIYVDNVITGTKTETEAVQFYKLSKSIFRDASMNLREWITNSKCVNASIPSEDRSECERTKVLGHYWNVKDDTLSLKAPTMLPETSQTTKRTVLKQIASVYDPLGLFCPILLRGKVLLQ